MQNLLQFLAKYGALLLFFFLEAISFFWVVKYNDVQKEIFIHSANLGTGKVYEQYDRLAQYYNLTSVVDSLARENAKLRNLVSNSFYGDTLREDAVFDSIYVQQYNYIDAKVINNSLRQKDNYLTLNRGEMHGVGPGMGVIGSEGIVGIVRNTSKHYSQVTSIFNSQIRISAANQKTNFFGALIWDGSDLQHMTLVDIPKHAQVHKGDSIVTTGYSPIFPEGIYIGSVDSFNIEAGSNFYSIRVALVNDLNQIGRVYIVKNMMKSEQDSLEMKNKRNGK